MMEMEPKEEAAPVAAHEAKGFDRADPPEKWVFEWFPRHVRRTIHYTELEPANPDWDRAVEFNCYRRELGRLLSEGREGQWVLIRGEEVLSFHESYEVGTQEGNERFPDGSFLVWQVLTYMDIIDIQPRYRRCRA